MNRRNFFKVVTGFVAGIFATSVEGKRRSGTRYCGEASTSIDPNSEWAKQKYLTLDEIIKIEEALISDKLYCRGKNGTLCPRCKFNECRWPEYCKLNRLRVEAAVKAANPPYVLFDDSKTIQEAIDLAKDGGVVYFPKGTYNLKYGIIV